MKVPIEVSARHIHISQKDLEILFGKGYVLNKHLKPLSQPGQYAEEETLKIIGPKRSYDTVRILGPVREQTQVELSLSDCFYLGIEPVLRLSGDLKGTSPCVLIGPKGELDLREGVVVVKRHLHIHTKDAQKIGIKNHDSLKLKVEGERALEFDAIIVRISDRFATSVHLDTDEGNAGLVKTGDLGEIIIK